jgi:hypothetical protein
MRAVRAIPLDHAVHHPEQQAGQQRRVEIGSHVALVDGGPHQRGARGRAVRLPGRGVRNLPARCTIGAVSLAVNWSLEPDELAAGVVLTCQAQPATPGVRLEYL